MVHKAFIICLSATLILLGGCGLRTPTPESFCAAPIDTAGFRSRIDRFVIIFDASSSMGRPYTEETKFEQGKSILNGLNVTLPELGQTAGLRCFGHSSCAEKKGRLYGMSVYHSGALADQAYLISKPGGTGFLAKSVIASLWEDLCGFSKATALIVITDGQGLDNAGIDEIRAVVKQNPACVYSILVGNDPRGEKALAALAAVGACGFLSRADDLADPRAMAAFVKTVFLEKTITTDTILPKKKSAKSTPLPDATGFRFDDHVLFDFDRAVVKPQAYPFLSRVVQTLKAHPKLGVSLYGHTDYIGPETYNLGLSLRRAKAVAAYLVSKGINANRITTEGLGFSQPVCTNATRSGRALNRRVEILPR